MERGALEITIENSRSNDRREIEEDELCRDDDLDVR